MSKKRRLGIVVVFIAALLVLAGYHLSNHDVALLQPRGTVGVQEKHLILVAFWLSMIVVIPVYLMMFGFAWRYRETNKKARYQPELSGNRLFESIWWGVPLVIISILAVITFKSSHQLDPFRPLNSSVRPIKIQVIALQWKWLFIYPEQSLASVNFVQFPANTPIKFDITSDAPMNSFWIPQLGGQIYAMSGMNTQLNLEASKIGDFQGYSANVSGEGFSSMRFTARASTEADFNKWLKTTKQSLNVLTMGSYNQLQKPSKNEPVKFYSPVKPGIFESVIAKYQEPVYFNPETAR